MKSQLAVLIILSSIHSIAFAQSVDSNQSGRLSGGESVPKHILEAIGLSGIEVIDSDDGPNNVRKDSRRGPGSDAAERNPAEAAAADEVESARTEVNDSDFDQTTVGKQEADARRKRILDSLATRAILAERKLKVAERRSQRSKSRLKTAEEALVQARTDKGQVAQFIQELTLDRNSLERQRAQTTALAKSLGKRVEQNKAKKSELVEQEESLLRAFESHNELVNGLNEIHVKLQNVAERFDDPTVTEHIPKLEKVLTEKRDELSIRKEKLTQTQGEIVLTSQELQGVVTKVDQIHGALGESRVELEKLNERLQAAQRTVEQKSEALKEAESTVERMEASHQAARNQRTRAQRAARRASADLQKFRVKDRGFALPRPEVESDATTNSSR